MKKIFVWFNAVRPLSLLASIAPVLVGSSMAYGDGFFHLKSAAAAFFVAVFVQIGTNLSNDYFDFESGVDRVDDARPHSAILSGKLSAMEMRWGFLIAFLLAAVSAKSLIARAGTPALIIAGASIFSGLAYTAGKWSLSRLGLGDLFVFVFFGPVAVAGTYYVQALECNGAVLTAGFMTGFLSTAVLVLNNLRDMIPDAGAGRRTLAVRCGKSFSRMEYLFCLLAAAAAPVMVYVMVGERVWMLFSSVLVFLMIPLVGTVFSAVHPGGLNRALVLTTGYLFLQSCVYSLVWLL